MLKRKMGSVLLLSAMVFTGCSSASGTSSTASTMLEKIAERGVLNVGISTDKLGFALENTATGELEGLEVEMTKQIAADIAELEGVDSIDVDYTKVGSTTRTALLDEGSIDIIAASYTDTEKRAETWNCSSAYFNDSVSVMTKKGVYANGVADFLTKYQETGKKTTIAIGLGTTSGDALKEYMADTLGMSEDEIASCLEIKEFQTTDEIVIALDTGVVDGWCVDYTYLFSYKNDTLEILGETAGDMFVPQPLGIVTVYNNGVNEEDLEFTKFIQDEVRKFWESGQMNEWLVEFGYPEQDAPDTLDCEYGPYFHIDQQ